MKQRSLSELEQEVMNIVWQLENCSVRDVLNKLNRTKKLAYTTVSTILQRLYGKGLVKRKVDGIAFKYFPRLSKEIYSKSMAKSFISKFIDSFGDTAIVSFAESVESLPKEKRAYFLRLIKKYEHKNS